MHSLVVDKCSEQYILRGGLSIWRGFKGRVQHAVFSSAGACSGRVDALRLGMHSCTLYKLVTEGAERVGGDSYRSRHCTTSDYICCSPGFLREANYDFLFSPPTIDTAEVREHVDHAGSTRSVKGNQGTLEHWSNRALFFFVLAAEILADWARTARPLRKQDRLSLAQ